MPLNDGAINEILPFAPDGLESSGDLMPLAEYADDNMRLRGHQPGLARRGLQNRAQRQAAHVAAGMAQFIANRYEAGVRDDGDIDAVEEGLQAAVLSVIPPPPGYATTTVPGLVRRAPDAGDAEDEDGYVSPAQLAGIARYELCEVYYFRHPTLRPGFQAAQGGLIANAATLYPEAWAYLQTAEGQLLCTTEAEWQAMVTAIWHTNADGSTVGWNGIGGAPFYVQDLEAGTLRVPDLRGMYPEAAGFDSLGVGGVHGDAIRPITGSVRIDGNVMVGTGAFQTQKQGAVSGSTASENLTDAFTFDPARVVPVAAKNQPRAWGALACVYLGRSAS